MFHTLNPYLHIKGHMTFGNQTTDLLVNGSITATTFNRGTGGSDDQIFHNINDVKVREIKTNVFV